MMALSPLRCICAVALALAAPLTAQAAGFDCAKAGTPVEKAICASPALSDLDGQLAAAFRAALASHPEQADVLKRDQSHWLGERDDRGWSFISGGLKDQVTPVLTTEYTRRIDFLKGLDAKAPPPMDGLRALLLPGKDVGNDPFEALAKDKSSHLTLDRETALDNVASFRLKPDTALRNGMSEQGVHLTDRVLDGASVGSVYTIQGTAYCWSEMPYRIVEGDARNVPTPGAWDGSDCGSSHHLMRMGDSVLAVKLESTPSSVLIEGNAWQGTGFGPTQALALRFDTVLSVTGSACAPTQSPCADFGAVALSTATRYARRPLAGTLDRPLTGSAKEAYEAALAVARAPGGMATKGAMSGAAVAVPSFGARLTDGLDSYDSEATLFPMVFRGETLLGYIGHAHIGWRTDANWLVSAWRVKDGKLEPVAGAHIAVSRGKLLLTSVVPPPPVERH